MAPMRDRAHADLTRFSKSAGYPFAVMHFRLGSCRGADFLEEKVRLPIDVDAAADERRAP